MSLNYHVISKQTPPLPATCIVMTQVPLPGDPRHPLFSRMNGCLKYSQHIERLDRKVSSVCDRCVIGDITSCPSGLTSRIQEQRSSNNSHVNASIRTVGSDVNDHILKLVMLRYDWKHELIRYLAHGPVRVSIQTSTISISFSLYYSSSY